MTLGIYPVFGTWTVRVRVEVGILVASQYSGKQGHDECGHR